MSFYAMVFHVFNKFKNKMALSVIIKWFGRIAYSQETWLYVKEEDKSDTCSKEGEAYKAKRDFIELYV